MNFQTFKEEKASPINFSALKKKLNYNKPH